MKTPLFLATTLAITSSVQALTYNWTGSTSSDFQTAGNWVESAWDQWGDYRFGSNVTNGTVTVNNFVGWGPIFLDSGLTSDIVIGGPQPVIMAANWSVGATITIATDSRNLTINNAYNSNGAVTWNVGANRSLTLNNTLSDWNGTASLVKQGDGTALLTGTNTYSGGTTVSGGTLRIELGNRSGNAALGAFSVASGATLNLDNTNTTVGDYYPQNVVLSGAGTVTKTGTGSIDFWTGSSLTGFTGTMDVQEGALRINNIGTNGNMGQATLNIASGATFDVRYGSHLTVDKLTGTGTLDQSFNFAPALSVTVGSNNGSSTFGGVITNSSGQALSLTKSGSGTFTLTGTNTYTGNTTVNAGTLSLGDGTHNSNLSDGATVSIAFGATVNLNFTGSDTVGKLIIDGETLSGGTYNATTHPDYFTGTGSLTVINQDGIWTSTASGNWGSSANWQSNVIANGADKIATFSAGTGSEAITVTLDTGREIANLAFSNATYTLAGGNTLTFASTSATPAISVAPGLTTTITSKLGGTAGLEKNGPGTLTLIAGSGDNYTNVYNHNISGGLNITQGTVEFASQYIRMGSINIGSGTTLRTTIPWATGSSSNFGLNGASAGSVIVDAGGTLTTTTLAQALTEGLTLNGGSVTAPGVTSGDWGAFIIASTVTADGAAASSISAELALAGNQYFDVLTGSTLDVSGVIHNRAGTTGAITKFAEGTLTLGGANYYSGSTVVDDGTLNVTGSLSFYPTTNGSTNSVSGSSTATLFYTGTVNLELGSAVAAAGNTWNLINLGSFSGPSPILDPAAVTSSLGGFSEVTEGTWEFPVTGAKWVFTEADGNLAYVVTASDYDNWGAPYGLSAGSEAGDLDNDGLTNHEEYAFGLIPNSGASVNPIAVQLDKTTGTFFYTRRPQSLTSLTYTVWYSTDLASWSQDTGATEGTPAVSGEVETVPVTISPALLTNPKLFIQVRAE